MKMRAIAQLILAGILCLSAPAFAIYKCDTNGDVTYTDAPCRGGKQLGILSAPDTSDAHHRATQEKQMLKQLENERHKKELKEEKDRQKASRLQATKQRKCASLERRKKWAAEDAAAAYGKSAEKAKRKARRAEETFEAECRI